MLQELLVGREGGHVRLVRAEQDGRALEAAGGAVFRVAAHDELQLIFKIRRGERHLLLFLVLAVFAVGLVEHHAAPGAVHIAARELDIGVLIRDRLILQRPAEAGADRLRKLDIKTAVAVAVGIAHGKALLVQAHDERALRNVAECVERIGVAVKGRVVRAEPLEREAVDRPVGREDLERGVDIHRRLISVAKADAKLLRAERLDHAVAADRLAARCTGNAQRERKQQRRDPFCMLQGKPSQIKIKKAHRDPMRFLSYRISHGRARGKS